MQQHPWGIYVHIPYCPSICPYCDFNVWHRRRPPWEALFAAMQAELRAQLAGAFAGMPPPVSLYFGGGTPSLAPPALVGALLAAVRQHTGLPITAEISLEANPGSVDLAGLRALRQAGINRLSLGWQSTHDRLLRQLGRTHDAAAGRQAAAMARAAGFDNLGLDLIFAVPTQSRAECAADVAALLGLRPQHISLYALTYHAGTAFFRRRQRGELQPATEALELQMMRDIGAALKAAGYVHEEVSNFGLPGFAARHNRLYWQGGAYLGLGPGAHSFCHRRWQAGRRWENLRHPERYIRHWQAGGAPAAAGLQAQEDLSAEQLLCERLLCGLRQPQGISLAASPLCDRLPRLQAGLQAGLARRWLRRQPGRLRPTARGLEQADALAALFF